MRNIFRNWLLLFCIINSKQPLSQNLTCNWMHTFGNPAIDEGNYATTDSNGNFLVVGSFTGTIDVDPSTNAFHLSASITNAFVAKYTPDQGLIWAFTFVGNSSVTAEKIRALDDGRILVCGQFSQTCDFDPGPNEFLLQSFGFQDAFMAVYTSDGTFVYAVSIGGAQGDDTSFDANVDALGNFYFTGYFISSADIDPSPSQYIVYEYTGASLDLFLVKLSPSYEFIWGGIVSGPGFEIAAAISISESNTIVIAGLVEGSPDFDLTDDIQYADVQVGDLSHQNCFIVRYSADGQLIDAKIFGGLGHDYIISMVSNSAGYLIAGTYSGSGDFNPGQGVLDFESFGSYDAFIMQLDTDLNTIWSYNIGNSESDRFHDLAIDEFGNIAAAGSFSKSIDFDNGASEYILTAHESLGGFYYDAMVVILSPGGQFMEAKNWGSWFYDLANGVAISGSRVFLTGYYTNNIALDGCTSISDGGNLGDAFMLCLNSEYLSIENEDMRSSTIYPNPADQFINIKFGQRQALNHAVIKLYDMQGRLIEQTPLLQQQTTYMFDCVNLESGAYLLRIESEAFVTSKKIVVAH